MRMYFRLSALFASAVVALPLPAQVITNDASTTYDPIDQRLDIMFPVLAVEKGPGIPIHQSRGLWRLALNLEVPAGWQYAIRAFDLYGEVKLQRTLTATVDVRLSFPNGRTVATASYKGRFHEAVHLQKTFEPADWLWSPCDAASPIQISIQPRITQDTGGEREASGFVSFDPYFYPGRFWLAFRRCSMDPEKSGDSN